jgi:type IV fimbrial biogenesis protein FimT
MKKTNRSQMEGLTLLELLITLVVLAIILSLATPGFRTQILNSQAAAMGETLGNTLGFARSEALKRKARVTVCGSSNGTSCDASDWANGLLVFVDEAATDNAASPQVGDTLRVVGAFDPGANIVVSDGKTFIRYLPSGAIARLDNNPLSIQAHTQGCTGNVARKLSISLSGSISVEREACP